MKKRTTEEMREYQRKRRARQRGVTPEEQGVTPPDKTLLVDKVDMSTARLDELAAQAEAGFDLSTWHPKSEPLDEEEPF